MSMNEDAARRAVLADAARHWWMLLVAGICWVLISLAILQFDLTSVWSIAILTGIVLIFAGVDEVFTAAVSPNWKWVHGLLAVLFLAGGVIAFAWPQSTFEVIARLFAWYLLFKGTFDVIIAVENRTYELWWLLLITGIAEIVLAFWAVGYQGRAAALLILWVGIGALFRGVTNIFVAFQLRSLRDRLPPGAGGTGESGQLPLRPSV
ncbi:MAG: HdeD family acid-resistance protein [Frankiaceae bacterium]